MAKTSWNISERIFFTVNHNGSTARFGELDGLQKILLNLTNEELIVLVKILKNFELSDITPES